MKDLVALARALSEPNRVRILAALRSGELCVCELSDALGLGQSTLSTHLQAIRKAGLVTTRRQGKWSYYALSETGAVRLGALFQCFGTELASDARLKADRSRIGARVGLRRDGECCVGYCGTGEKGRCA
jgi:ArsR family transcriptional regulator